MANNQKIRLGIVFGGRSGEYEVSLTSAASVMQALDPDVYAIIAIGITQSGTIAGPEELKRMLPESLLPRLNLCYAIQSEHSGMVVASQAAGSGSESAARPQIIFPLLHGPYGEDGTIQGLLEIARLPYIGCGVLASAVAMDKDVVKKLWLQAGLPVTPSLTVHARDVEKDLAALQQAAASQFGYPMFSKPANLGSSVGVCKIRDAGEFAPAVRLSAQYDRKILIEKGIDGREVECAILGNDDPVASVVGEVISSGEFYDYEAKYVSRESRLEIPARIDAAKAEEIRALAVKAFRVIDGSGLSRVDFFLEHHTGKVWINEINTMPGFTPISMYSKLWAASGIPFDALMQRLIRLGEERFLEKSAYKISGR